MRTRAAAPTTSCRGSAPLPPPPTTRHGHYDIFYIIIYIYIYIEREIDMYTYVCIYIYIYIYVNICYPPSQGKVTWLYCRLSLSTTGVPCILKDFLDILKK